MRSHASTICAAPKAATSLTICATASRASVEQTEQVRDLATTLMPAFARRLEARLKELLGGTVAIDPARIAQEAALLARTQRHQ